MWEQDINSLLFSQGRKDKHNYHCFQPAGYLFLDTVHLEAERLPFTRKTDISACLGQINEGQWYISYIAAVVLSQILAEKVKVA